MQGINTNMFRTMCLQKPRLPFACAGCVCLRWKVPSNGERQRCKMFKCVVHGRGASVKNSKQWCANTLSHVAMERYRKFWDTIARIITLTQEIPFARPCPDSDTGWPNPDTKTGTIFKKMPSRSEVRQRPASQPGCCHATPSLRENWFQWKTKA